MPCAVCGQPLSPGARFCSNCGAVVGTVLGTQERKMVTILFADLVDSTGLAQSLDPERAREVMGRFFEAATEELQALRGRPEKFIGDAVMAVFGLPHVHEDDAIRAVRAGMAIRERVRRLGRAEGLAAPLEVRIGIESGEAATGVGPAGQLLVTGPVVNMAARLQSAARPGQILAGHTTRALTVEAVSYGHRRMVRAKGFEAELASFPVEALSTRSTRRTIAFVGRASEQAILRQSLSLAITTGRPVLVTILGEAGIGKTRLAAELVASLDASVVVVRGRSRSYTDTATFGPAAAIVGELAGIRDGEPHEATKRRLRELAERSVEASEVDATAERLGLLFGVAGQLEESAFVHDVTTGFIALVDGLAQKGTVVLVFEDLHTLRPMMLDLIERLGAKGPRGPRRALVVALARPELLEARPSWGTSSGNAVLVHLDPLSGEESMELVRAAGGDKIDEQESAAIAARAGGNPYFIIETTGMLMAEGGSGLAGGAANLPPTVQAVVAARLDALPSRLRDLARRASVFLYSFDMAELVIVDGAPKLEELQMLEDNEIIVRDEGRVEAQWRMRHATLREVAYASLPKRERLRLHELVAQNLLDTGHPSWAADHLELAALAARDLDPIDRSAPERAAEGLLVAGDRARRRMESRSAVDFYERSLAMSGPDGRWGIREARVLAGLGESRYWLGTYPAAIEALERSVALATAHDDAAALTHALRFLGDIAINVEADVDKAELLLDRSLSAAEKLGDDFAITRTLLFAGWVPWTRDHFDEAEVIWRRALSLAGTKDRWARVRALTSLSINQVERNNFDEAMRLIDEATALAEQTGDQFSVAVTAVQKGRVFEDLGRYDESLVWLDKGIKILGELGARWELADARATRGIAKRELGRFDEAEEDLRYAIRASDELGERQLAGWTWRAFGRVAELRGDHAEAEKRYRRSQEADAHGPRKASAAASTGQPGNP
ncbi:MAG TPA: adenylate/guanylate cyclase domain-containing protein [Candidatus Acidoferrum sp.]|jgi:class 3 adenylate cyclase/tetratricopeptide (TPR) repeat protein|nr:adenylate/guanylate cyclase domain-containing protein [Candidatus Acidoferrum sp.]